MKTPPRPRALCLALAAAALATSALAQPSGDFSPPAPPSGLMPPPPPGGAPGTARRAATTGTAAATYRDSGKRTEKNETYVATETDESAILATGGTKLVLHNPTVHSSASTSDEEASSFHGLAAAVLATKGGAITITGGSVNSSGHGANTVFAHGQGSVIKLSKTKITASGPAAHGIMAAGGGEITADDLDVATSGVRSAPIATDRGGGKITVARGRYRSTGTTSPAIYSTGEIVVSDADLLAADSEAAVVEGSNSIALANCVLSGARKRGVMIYQSFSGDADGRRGSFEMTGGSLSAAEGPLFYVTNTTGAIRLSGVSLAPASGKLLLSAVGEWGREGSNGGDARLVADAQTLAGDLAADADSELSVTLENQSTLTGAIRRGSLTFDDTSRWTATADSTLVVLSVKNDDPAELSRIRSYGYTITYDDTRSENRWLSGKTYPLSGGGKLTPAAR